MVSTLFTILILALAASSSAKDSQHATEMKEHYDHLIYLTGFSCHQPQPRVISVNKLLSPYQTRGKAYFPEMTVLHRCDEYAGSCEKRAKCAPLHAEVLHLPFKVTYMEDMGDKVKGQWEMEYYNFDNHTVCGCGNNHEQEHNLNQVHEESTYEGQLETQGTHGQVGTEHEGQHDNHGPYGQLGSNDKDQHNNQEPYHVQVGGSYPYNTYDTPIYQNQHDSNFQSSNVPQRKTRT